MPRRGPAPEKAKDFKGSMKRLVKNLSKWKYIMIMALVLAFISAILALIAPNKLSQLTDVITFGIQPNISEEVVQDILSNENISESDKKEFKDILKIKDDKHLF